MSDRKDTLELAAEITIAAMDPNHSYIDKPESVMTFFRTIYKEIARCECTTLKELN